MNGVTVIHGTFADSRFVPDAPPPPIAGRAELIVYPEKDEGRRPSGSSEKSRESVFDFLGKAPTLRCGEEIDAQIEAERRAWDDG